MQGLAETYHKGAITARQMAARSTPGRTIAPACARISVTANFPPR